MKNSDNKISIIIRNKNENEFIGFTIQSVLDTFKKDDIEIIVIDNNSSDDSLEIVKLFNMCDISIFKIDNYMPGRALNTGVSACSHDTVLVLSAHSQIVGNICIKSIKDRLDNYCCVFGKQVPVFRGKKISRRYIWSNFTDSDSKNMWSKLENRYFLHNAFCFYRKKTLMDHPFDETLPGKEDRYWIKRMIDLNYSSYYDSSITCFHHWTVNGATWKGIG